MGRSCGGYTTKIHLACTDEDTAIAVELTPGQAGDAPQFSQLFQTAQQRVPETDEVVADKSYDSHCIRRQALDALVAVQIPSRSTARDPWPVLTESYRQRNRVERLINKLKQFRGIAIRYDKLANNLLASIKTVLTFIKLRRFVNRTYPQQKWPYS
ncbi:IS5 family transposase [bacterium]|nr:IS5 family transposase [bacterium]